MFGTTREIERVQWRTKDDSCPELRNTGINRIRAACGLCWGKLLVITKEAGPWLTYKTCIKCGKMKDSESERTCRFGVFFFLLCLLVRFVFLWFFSLPFALPVRPTSMEWIPHIKFLLLKITEVVSASVMTLTDRLLSTRKQTCKGGILN